MSNAVITQKENNEKSKINQILKYNQGWGIGEMVFCFHIKSRTDGFIIYRYNITYFRMLEWAENGLESI